MKAKFLLLAAAVALTSALAFGMAKNGKRRRLKAFWKFTETRPFRGLA